MLIKRILGQNCLEIENTSKLEQGCIQTAWVNIVEKHGNLVHLHAANSYILQNNYHLDSDGYSSFCHWQYGNSRNNSNNCYHLLMYVLGTVHYLTTLNNIFRNLQLIPLPRTLFFYMSCVSSTHSLGESETSSSGNHYLYFI